MSHLDWEPILYIEFGAYDETSLVVQVSSDTAHDVSTAFAAILDEEHLPAPDDAILPLPGTSATRTVSDTIASKIFQMANWIVMMVRIGPNYKTIRFNKINPFRQLETTEAEILYRTLTETCSLSEAADKFKARLRCATTDLGSSNLRTEWFFRVSRPTWWMLHIPCHVHRCATCHGRVFRPIELVVTYAIRWSLSLSVAGSMKNFRASLVDMLVGRMVILRGRCSPEAEACRNACLDMYLPKTRAGKIRRATLASSLRGDWRNSKNV